MAADCTKTVLIAVAAVLILYDIFVIAAGRGTDATVSVIMYRWSEAKPIVAIICGAVCAHLFCPLLGIHVVDSARDRLFVFMSRSPGLFFAAAVIIFTVPWPKQPAMAFFIGLLFGYLFWPQWVDGVLLEFGLPD